MEEVLVGGTSLGLSAIQELSSRLTATAQTQRVLAQKVGQKTPVYPCCVRHRFLECPSSPPGGGHEGDGRVSG